jgi:N-formylglutamate amidohydrolase
VSVENKGEAMGIGSSGDRDLEDALANRVRSRDLELCEPFELADPEEITSPLVFSSPHSGSIYPASFLEKTRLDESTLRRSEDAHVDSLFASANSIGAPLLHARFPRAYLDLNREPYELDPRMFEERLPEFVNTRSLRVAAGLGTIPRVVADAREIYAAKLTVEEAFQRIESLYKPYHRVLRCLMERAWRRFGMAVLVDCHSMPTHVPRESAPARSKRANVDFVIGDRFGQSCSLQIVEAIEHALQQFGYKIQRNRPYAGGYITESYGKPASGWHAVQIEVARRLYMDEATLVRNEKFDSVVEHLGEVVRLLARITPMRDERAAAE